MAKQTADELLADLTTKAVFAEKTLALAKELGLGKKKGKKRGPKKGGGKSHKKQVKAEAKAVKKAVRKSKTTAPETDGFDN